MYVGRTKVRFLLQTVPKYIYVYVNIFISISGTLYNKDAFSGASRKTCLPHGSNKSTRIFANIINFWQICVITSLFASSVDRCAVNCNTYSNLIYLRFYI